MKIKPIYLGLTAIVILFGSILVASSLNLWHTESSKVPITFKEGEFAGEYNPDDIRGSYTFEDVSRLFGIPLEELGKAFGLGTENNIREFKNKDLEARYGNLEGDLEIGNSSVKLFVALYKGLPFPLDDDIYLLKPAVNILKGKGKLTQEQVNYVDGHMVELQSKATNEQIIYEEHEEIGQTIRGKTTFRELLDWGVSKERIETIIGEEITNPALVIRDFCQQVDVPFSSIKGKLQDEVDALKK